MKKNKLYCGIFQRHYPDSAVVTLAALFATTMLAAGTANAQEGVNNKAIEEIIVTTQKRSESLQDVPIAVTALGGDALFEQNINNVSDLVGRVPSVNLTPRRGFGVVTIRGIGFEVLTAGADPGVAVHLDGVYAARPAAALANFYDAERLEVARGPQGTLYGRNATGGAVNIVSKMPTVEPSGYINITVGNYDAVTLEGALSGAIGSDKVLGRIAFKHDYHDSYGDSFGGNEINDLDTSAVKGTLQIEPSENLTIVLRGDYFKQDDHAFTPVLSEYYNCSALAALNIRTCGTDYGGQITDDWQDVAYDYDTVNERTYAGASADITWELGWATFRSISAWRSTEYDFTYDLDGSSFPIGFIGRIEDGNQYSQEFQILGESGKLRWLAGAFYFVEDNDAVGLGDIWIPDHPSPLVNTPPGISVYQYSNLKTTAYALFGQLTYQMTEKLAITLGARYSDEKKEDLGAYVRQYLSVPYVVSPDRSESFDAFSPKITFEYAINPDALVYFNIQNGFKSGGFTAGAPSDPAFDQEDIWSYEAGLKATWLDGKLRTNLSAFYYDYTDLQVGSLDPGGEIRTVVTNAASAEVTGFEAEITALITDAFTLEGNISIVDATYKDYKNAFNTLQPALGYQDISGNDMAQSPDLTYMVAAQYEWDVESGAVTLRGEYLYSDEVYFDTFEDPRNGQDDYDLINIYLNYASAGGGWKVGLFGRNLADEEYFVGSSPSINLLGHPVPMTPGSPRTFGVKAGYQF